MTPDVRLAVAVEALREVLKETTETDYNGVLHCGLCGAVPVYWGAGRRCRVCNALDIVATTLETLGRQRDA
jgi:hypothetical protein